MFGHLNCAYRSRSNISFPCLVITLLAFALFGLSSSAAFAGDVVCLSVEEGLDRVCARDIARDSSCGGKGRIAWRGESCLKSHPGDILPEITGLDSGAVLPIQLLRSEYLEKVAISLNYRFFQRYERPKITNEDVLKQGYDLWMNANPQLNFDARYLESTIVSGFLNQHQTGSSSVFYAPEIRERIENSLADVLLEPTYTTDRKAVVHELRPKYAYGTFKSFHPGLTTYLPRGGYGNVLAVFKDEVKKRISLTSGDSLNMGLGSTNFWYDPTTGTSFKLDQTANGRRISLYYLKKDFNFPKRTGNYYEMQIFGPLKIEHVAYFLVNCPDFAPEGDAIIEVLRNAGITIPVYQCTRPDDPRTSQYQRGELLYGQP